MSEKQLYSALIFLILFINGIIAFGNTIAFYRDGDIYSVDPKSGTISRITVTFSAFEPAWSPNGERIAVVSGRDRNGEVYVLNADGSSPQNVTNHVANDRFPTWSPDGRQIAFVSDRNAPQNPYETDIYVMNADGANVRRLTNGVASGTPRDQRAPDQGIREEYPAWSPDGRHILFMSNRHIKLGDGILAGAEIYLMDADGSNQRRLTFSPINEAFPAWSPDGTQIAVSYGKGLALMNLDGQIARIVTEDQGGGYPTWSPDGTQIAFQRGLLEEGKPYNSEIFVINVDGTNLRNLTNSPAYDGFPNWCRVSSTTAAHPQGKMPFTWGWLKALGASLWRP